MRELRFGGGCRRRRAGDPLHAGVEGPSGALAGAAGGVDGHDRAALPGAGCGAPGGGPSGARAVVRCGVGVAQRRLSDRRGARRDALHRHRAVCPAARVGHQEQPGRRVQPVQLDVLPRGRRTEPRADPGHDAPGPAGNALERRVVRRTAGPARHVRPGKLDRACDGRCRRGLEPLLRDGQGIPHGLI